jgi:cytochrome c
MTKSKIITTIAGIALAATLSSGATMAADGAALYQAKTCFACHGMDAKTPITPLYPKLAGQNKDYALNQMKDIKSGARNNGQTGAMKGIMATVSEAEMAAIADWLSSLK